MRAWTLVRDGEVIGGNADASPVPWWSFGKTVIAIAALQLVGEGRLTLDAPLTHAQYTLRQLLQHRAGLPDYGGLADYHRAVARGERPWPVVQMLRAAHADRLLFAPGERFHYSNIGYLKVVQLIEAAAEKPLAMVLAEAVFAPLAVRGTLATDRGASALLPADYDPGWVYHGLLVGPLADTARVLDGLLHGRLLKDSLLTQAAQLIPIGFPTPGRPVSVAGYGLGLMGEADPAVERPIVGHNGAGPGSLLVVRNDGQITVAAISAGEGLAEGELERFVLARVSEARVQTPRAGSSTAVTRSAENPKHRPPTG